MQWWWLYWCMQSKKLRCIIWSFSFSWRRYLRYIIWFSQRRCAYQNFLSISLSLVLYHWRRIYLPQRYSMLLKSFIWWVNLSIGTRWWDYPWCKWKQSNHWVFFPSLIIASLAWRQLFKLDCSWNFPDSFIFEFLIKRIFRYE